MSRVIISHGWKEFQRPFNATIYSISPTKQEHFLPIKISHSIFRWLKVFTQWTEVCITIACCILTLRLKARKANPTFYMKSFECLKRVTLSPTASSPSYAPNVKCYWVSWLPWASYKKFNLYAYLKLF